MPKRAPAASHATKGGYGARRSEGGITKLGRLRCAPRWTASAAIAASIQVQEFCKAWNKTQDQVFQWHLQSPDRAARFADGPSMRHVIARDRELVRSIW
jgi:hypothetical protein